MIWAKEEEEEELRVVSLSMDEGLVALHVPTGIYVSLRSEESRDGWSFDCRPTLWTGVVFTFTLARRAKTALDALLDRLTEYIYCKSALDAETHEAIRDRSLVMMATARASLARSEIAALEYMRRCVARWYLHYATRGDLPPVLQKAVDPQLFALHGCRTPRSTCSAKPRPRCSFAAAWTRAVAS